MDTHYKQQKKQCSAYFRVRAGDLSKLRSGQYTIFDFVENSFAFSPPKREACIKLLSSLKEGAKTFTQLQNAFSFKKSSLFLVLTSLSASGLIEKNGKDYVLSDSFSTALSETAGWWRAWKNAET